MPEDAVEHDLLSLKSCQPMSAVGSAHELALPAIQMVVPCIGADFGCGPVASRYEGL